MFAPTFRQLEILKSVVDCGSFRAAADALGISQPSVSMHVRALEARMRQRILERQRGHAPVLTPIGRRIYLYANQVLDHSSQASAEIRSLQSAQDNVLSFAAQRFIANHLLSKPLADFAQRNPGTEIIANIGALERTMDNIRHRDIDVALFLARGPVESVRSWVIGHQELVFIAAADHPLASRRNLSCRDLADFPFIGPVKNTQYGQMLHDVFADLGLTDYATIVQSQHTLIRKELIQSGLGLSCALRTGIKEDLAQRRLVALDLTGGPVLLEVRIGSLPDRQISGASRKFVDYVNELKAQGAFDSAPP